MLRLASLSRSGQTRAWSLNRALQSVKQSSQPLIAYTVYVLLFAFLNCASLAAMVDVYILSVALQYDKQGDQYLLMYNYCLPYPF